jgi:small subunit ribosomal protein S18
MLSENNKIKRPRLLAKPKRINRDKVIAIPKSPKRENNRTKQKKVSNKRFKRRRSYKIRSWEIPNYKYADLVLRSISDYGRILSYRLTRANRKQQRQLTKAVKHARILGLLPFVHTEFNRARI